MGFQIKCTCKNVELQFEKPKNINNIMIISSLDLSHKNLDFDEKTPKNINPIEDFKLENTRHTPNYNKQ